MPTTPIQHLKPHPAQMRATYDLEALAALTLQVHERGLDQWPPLSPMGKRPLQRWPATTSSAVTGGIWPNCWLLPCEIGRRNTRRRKYPSRSRGRCSPLWSNPPARWKRSSPRCWANTGRKKSRLSCSRAARKPFLQQGQRPFC